MKIVSFRKLAIKFALLTLTLSFISTPIVNAIAADPVFYSRNDILFYNPEDGTCSTAVGGSFGDISGNSNAEKIWNYLMSQGLTEYQTAGVMGNIAIETAHTYSPTARQGTTNLWNSLYNDNAWGIVQWDGPRRYSSPDGGVLGSLRENAPHLEKYTNTEYDSTRYPDADIPEADLNELLLFELKYMIQESQTRKVSTDVAEQGYGVAGAIEWDTLKLQSSIMDAVVFWHNNFEVSAQDPEDVIKDRGSSAQEAYNSFSSGASPVSTTQAQNCAPSTSQDPGAAIQSGDLSYAVTSYAHPEWHDPNYTQMMSAYAAAVTKARNEDRYVGGGVYPGIDCGGFVSLLLVDSGFEPNYNSGQGNTVIQKQWLDANWKVVGNGASIDTGELKPGDVAMRPGHTFVFVGTIEGFNSTIASASYGGTSSDPAWRAPMAGAEELTDGRVTWYRKM